MKMKEKNQFWNFAVNRNEKRRQFGGVLLLLLYQLKYYKLRRNILLQVVSDQKIKRIKQICSGTKIWLAVTRIRTWVASATTKSTNHYTITATKPVSILFEIYLLYFKNLATSCFDRRTEDSSCLCCRTAFVFRKFFCCNECFKQATSYCKSNNFH